MKPDKNYLWFMKSLKQEIVNSRYQDARLANRGLFVPSVTAQIGIPDYQITKRSNQAVANGPIGMLLWHTH